MCEKGVNCTFTHFRGTETC